MKKIAFMAFMAFSNAVMAQTWIWYPGDMDIWTGNRINNLRTEDGGFFPVFWRTDGHCQTVEFSKTVELAEAEEVEIAAEGRYSVKIDKRYQFGMPGKVGIPKGKHTIKIAVNNIVSPPAIWVNGPTIKSDDTWTVSDYATAERSDTWLGIDGKPMFDRIDRRPSGYRLPVTAVAPAKKETHGREIFVDFARESMGYLMLNGVKGNGHVNVFYGESPDEAHNKRRAYLRDKIVFTADSITDMMTMTVTHRTADRDYRLPHSRAMRYALIECTGNVSLSGVTLMSEMKDLGKKYRGSFTCNDTLINRIWDVSAYTLHLTDREVMIEGIKRDRWMWSGDAIQSYLMNYYVFMDAPVVRRTIWALRGKDPVKQHINTILDYTFYWFNSVYDYYMYTGDREFVQRIYPRMQSLMHFVEGRLDSRGMVQGKKEDWVFIDWSPEKMPKGGQLSFEQIVYLRSLEAMSLCAGVAGNKSDSTEYHKRAEKLKAQLIPMFWNDSRKAFIHNVEKGIQNNYVTKYANMFAVLHDLVDEKRKNNILNNVLTNDSIMPITTPYMRFYELESLCALGKHTHVLKEMRGYWGGMLSEGATSFWETYDPKEKYPQRLAMYGHPYGKSLCHAWGASPVYLLGKYYLGIKPTKPGYEAWEAAPCLGDLKWMRGDVPAPNGNIHIEMTRQMITIYAEGCGGGTLSFKSRTRPKSSYGTPVHEGDGQYRLKIEPGKKMTVKYKEMK
ncbi:amylo-alpha-1,6-glucosidase [Xylanibacter muris]|uniref:Alpha-rhamnosidase n=1 Tax=Xylanibacter muris TaxID=2736290 RepID=A0ABX2ARH9_9BACT|nr:amylo-alpha-1,6-glucosidase [Xylanibacter muris]NPD92561.1 alpha-rhamnosidase [Xylanibacter muris]